MVELEFRDVGFSGARKTGVPGENIHIHTVRQTDRQTDRQDFIQGLPSKQGKNQQQTQLTYDTGPESNPRHIGGRRALSPLHQPGSPINNKFICMEAVLIFVILIWREQN